MLNVEKTSRNIRSTIAVISGNEAQDNHNNQSPKKIKNLKKVL